MTLYFLRHALAADKTEWKGSDSGRPLTKEGIRKMKKVAKGLKQLDLHIDWILTSPFRRAYETARIAAKALKAKKRLRILKSLTPEGNPRALVRHLGLNFRSWESVMLVGHEPYLGHLIGVLTTGSSRNGLELEKGGLARLSADSLTYDQCATLEWLLPPKVLKNLI